jgi:hypothetical protein
MRLLRVVAVLAVLGALAWPEIARYSAERRIGYATNAFRALVDRRGDEETAKNLLAVGELALTASSALPGDPRPWILAGSACYVTGRTDRALELYREAFSTGERAEIDLNLGRAYGLLRRADDAKTAYLRAGWVSPEILASLPSDVREPLLTEIARRSDELREGRLAAPPPLPEQERR